MYDLIEFRSLKAALEWANNHCHSAVTVAYREHGRKDVLGVLVRRPLRDLCSFSDAEYEAAKRHPKMPLTATSVFWLDVKETDEMFARLTSGEAT